MKVRDTKSSSQHEGETAHLDLSLSFSLRLYLQALKQEKKVHAELLF